jgi:hypothetical protein
MNRPWLRAAFAAALVIASSLAPGRAEIERLTLAQLVRRADDVVHGKVVAREVFRVDHPIDGPDLYFTRLTLDGRSLASGSPARLDVTFPGGTLPSGEGAWNSVAPSADDTRPGVEVVAFVRWSEDLGGGVPGNALYAAHGGLYRVARTRKGSIVLGRGRGYALESNVELTELGRQVASLR